MSADMMPKCALSSKISKIYLNIVDSVHANTTSVTQVQRQSLAKLTMKMMPCLCILALRKLLRKMLNSIFLS